MYVATVARLRYLSDDSDLTRVCTGQLQKCSEVICLNVISYNNG